MRYRSTSEQHRPIVESRACCRFHLPQYNPHSMRSAALPAALYAPCCAMRARHAVASLVLRLESDAMLAREAAMPGGQHSVAEVNAGGLERVGIKAEMPDGEAGGGDGTGAAAADDDLGLAPGAAGVKQKRARDHLD